MRYFSFEKDVDRAVLNWNNSQFDFADIVLFLTDNCIMYGAKIYALFNRDEIKNVLNYFICDFDLIKEDLGIGDYVERKGSPFSESFNPKRKIVPNNFSREELKKRAKFVYKNIFIDLKTIATKLSERS